MMNSYSNKIIKESFRSERGDHSIRIEEKPRDNIKSAKLVRTNSVQNSKMYFTNREKTTVSLKGKLFPQKTSNYSFIKKEFKTPKDPLKIKIQKIAKSPIKNIKIKTEFKTKLNSAKTEKKVVDAKNIKNLNSLNIERQSSNKLLSNRLLSPKPAKKKIMTRSYSIDARGFTDRDANLYKQYKINDVNTIIEVKEDKDFKNYSIAQNDPRGIKKVFKKLNTDKQIFNISQRNATKPDLKKKINTNITKNNLAYSGLYNTANVNAKNTKFSNLKKNIETPMPKVTKKPNKHMMAYAFSNPPPKSPKVRPLSDKKKTLNDIKKAIVKPKSGIPSKLPIKNRPQTAYKKYETDHKMHETSLSTQASYLFQGRIEDYAIGKEIGKGAYAIVKQALHKPTNRKMAVKIYEKSKLLDPQRKSSVKKEIQILKKIDHPNIVKLHEIIDSPKQILLVMELVNGVSLLSFLKSKENRRLDMNECKDVCYQIVNAIAHLHEKNIVHRDIKLENILIDENKKVKIIDFGFGCITADKKLDFFCGTPSYMPPEIVQKRDYIGEYADIWSLGILFYTLLCGAFPFRAQNEKELYSKIIRGSFVFPDHVPNSACIIIRKILNLNPNLRPSAEEILNDAWFNSVRMIEASKIYQSFELATSNTVPKLLSDT